MPEIVEVCLTALYINQTFKNKQITNITVNSGRYAKTPIVGLAELKKNLPVTVIRVNSKGKFIWFVVKNAAGRKFYIMNTFGLTGSWGIEKRPHSHVDLTFSDNKHLYYIDPRNFGTLEITDSKDKLLKKLDSLAPDLLKIAFTHDEFYERVVNYVTKNTKRHDDKIVEVLMDQKKGSSLGSGIGNYLAAEILFNAKMSPHTKIGQLYKDKTLANKLGDSIKKILKSVYMTAEVGYLEHLDPDLEAFVKQLRARIKKKPASRYNYHPDVETYRNFRFRVYRQKKYKEHDVKAEEIIKGRTTYWLPAQQV
jgi:DNA-formamidopyrimidine glycosylase